MHILFFLIVIFLITIYSFLSRRISPVPYFPSNKQDLPKILQSLKLRNSQTVIDLGAGDGLVIFEAAHKAQEKKLNTQFIAIELNPVLVSLLYIQKLFHPNGKNITILWANMFKLNVSIIQPFDNLTFYAYISPWYLKPLFLSIKEQMKSFELITYFYPLPKETLKPIKISVGKNRIFSYSQTA